MKYIFVNGYGWTGSSIVIDILKEYRNIFSLEEEFRLIKDPHGIIDLDCVLNSNTDMLNKDIAIKEFLNMVRIYCRYGKFPKPFGCNYEKVFGKEIYDYTATYISEITDTVYKGYWHYLDFNEQYFCCLFKRIIRRFYDDFKYQNMRISVQNEERFLLATRKYLNSIFSNLVKGHDIDTIVLDQAIPPMNLSVAGRYFDNYCTILVDRDPRDVYANLIKRKSIVGYDAYKTHNPKSFILWYKVQHQNYKNNQNVLKMYFEDIVFNPNKSIKKIEDFCGLNQSEHINQGLYFNPEKSRKNIGIYREYASNTEIEIIETELKEFIHDN